MAMFVGVHNAPDNGSVMTGGGCLFGKVKAAQPRRKAASYKNHESNPSNVKKHFLDHASTETPGQFRYHYKGEVLQGRLHQRSQPTAKERKDSKRVHLRTAHDRAIKDRTRTREARVKEGNKRYVRQTASTHFVGTSMMPNPPTPSLFPPPTSGVPSTDERNQKKQQAAQAASNGEKKTGGGSGTQRAKEIHPWSHWSQKPNE